MLFLLLLCSIGRYGADFWTPWYGCIHLHIVCKYCADTSAALLLHSSFSKTTKCQKKPLIVEVPRLVSHLFPKPLKKSAFCFCLLFELGN